MAKRKQNPQLTQAEISEQIFVTVLSKGEQINPIWTRLPTRETYYPFWNRPVYIRLMYANEFKEQYLWLDTRSHFWYAKEKDKVFAMKDVEYS